MKIETKYDIGQKIWVLYEEDCVVKIYDDEIKEIVINTAGKVLYFSNFCDEEIPEEYIILYEDHDKLVKEIKNLLNKGCF